VEACLEIALQNAESDFQLTLMIYGKYHNQ
jgi:hypothetical protein